MIYRALLSILAIAALLLCGAGCGDENQAPSQTGGESRSEQDQAPVAQDRSIRGFGVRASEPQKEAAVAALSGYLRARFDRDWNVACSYIAAPARRLLLDAAAHSKNYADSGCPRVLSVFLSVPSRSMRTEFLTVNPVVLKLKKSRGLLLYRDIHSAEYAIQMIVEEGKWKVGALAPVPLS